MSNVTLPYFFDDPASFSLRQETSQSSFASPFGGSEQVVDLQNDRLFATVTLSNRTHDEAGRVEAFVASMRGMTNTVQLYHLARPVPEGSLRGSPLSNGASAGADSMLIGASVGATLRAGDMLGVGGLLLQVSDDCAANASGQILVPFVNRIRKYINAGLPVIWDRPTAPFRLISPSAVQYIPGYSPEVSLDFVEAIA